MIRAIVFLLILVLPAQAQDFRGLIHGMATSKPARLGEPLDLRTQDGVNSALSPLPFERTSGVMPAAGEIIVIASSAFATTPLQPSPSDGLQVGETTLSEAIAVAGSEGFAFELAESWQGRPTGGSFLSFTLADHPELGLILAVFGQPDPDRVGDITDVADKLQDATVLSATVYDQSSIARYPMLAEMPRTPPPPDASPFALLLAEAFPLIEIPQ